MDEQKKDDREPESCARCRHVEISAKPYGAVEYSCGRRKEMLSSALLTKRRCAKFEP